MGRLRRFLPPQVADLIVAPARLVQVTRGSPLRAVIQKVLVTQESSVVQPPTRAQNVNVLIRLGDEHATGTQRSGSITSPNASQTLHSLLLKFVQVFMVQTAHTAIANARAHIDQRLARWILMAHDRTRDNALFLTHEFLALMLG